MTNKPQPLCELRIADSIFLGYVATQPTLAAVEQYRQELIDNHHPNAAHVPYAASLCDRGGVVVAADRSDDDIGRKEEQEGYDDDDEPTGSRVGLTLLKELNLYKKRVRRQSTIRIRGGSAAGRNPALDIDEDEDDDDSKGGCGAEDASGECGPPVATAIIVVRYFQERLLGVTCGRLRAVYERTARLALHRHLNGSDDPFVERFALDEENWKNLYGLGAGDTELILDVVSLGDAKSGEGTQTASQSSGSSSSIVQKLLSELQWEGMVGSKNEMLPRLQNLQADLPNEKSTLPIYRYPGNYSGTEWPTHPWSPTSLSIKRSVEQALRPLYLQHMNHCVSNLYRNGNDNINHHSDKDLDLNREGVIVSVSLGARRMMEVRDRQAPHDVARVELPEGSMFVLGPYTNARFTHSVLPLEGHAQDGRVVGFCTQGLNEGVECSVEGGGRISLTFRDVRTFLDVKSQRLFGQGVTSSDDNPLALNDDGAISEASLNRAVVYMRKEASIERNSAAMTALVMGAAAGYVSSSESIISKECSNADDGRGATSYSDTKTLLRSISAAVMSASVSYWCLQRLRRNTRQQREEKEARVFFSKKSASGNKY